MQCSSVQYRTKHCIVVQWSAVQCSVLELSSSLRFPVIIFLIFLSNTLHCTALHWSDLQCNTLFLTAVRCTVHCTALQLSTPHCVEMQCSLLYITCHNRMGELLQRSSHTTLCRRQGANYFFHIYCNTPLQWTAAVLCCIIYCRVYCSLYCSVHCSIPVHFSTRLEWRYMTVRQTRSVRLTGSNWIREANPERNITRLQKAAPCPCPFSKCQVVPIEYCNFFKVFGIFLFLSQI